MVEIVLIKLEPLATRLVRQARFRSVFDKFDLNPAGDPNGPRSALGIAARYNHHTDGERQIERRSWTSECLSASSWGSVTV